MVIVIVEDEIRIREGIARLIKKHFPNNYKIIEASCGNDGLSIIRENKPDIVITDIMMQPMGGLEMLTILINQDHLIFKTIILSAYSEFDFAKQAISLGVKEYLIKPIDVNEFIIIIKRLENEIIQDQLINPEIQKMFNSIEGIFYGLLSDKIIYDNKTDEYMKKKYSIMSDCQFLMQYIYLGRMEISKYNTVFNDIKMVYKPQSEFKYALFSFPEDNAVLCIYYCNWKYEYIENIFRNSILKKFSNSVSITDCFNSLEKMNRCYKKLKDCLQWNISLGEKFISINNLQIKNELIAPYPVQIERESILCLSTEDYKSLHDHTVRFLQIFHGKGYTPDSIKKCCVRYFMRLLQVLKDLNFTVYETINEQDILDEITAAKTSRELEKTLSEVLSFQSEHNIMNTGVLVKKVIRIIEEQYKTGITLKEAAVQIGLSPDYISSQFNRELGMNFSTYIKKYRIGKAKELLTGTNLRILEIAHRIGIDDPKYFGRVFKETEGIRPAEYRKKYR